MRIKESILNTHQWVPKSELGLLLDTLKAQLSVSSRYNSDAEVPTYLETEDMLGMPRYFRTPYLEFENIRDQTAPGYRISFKVTSGYREGQKSLIDSLAYEIANKRTGFIIDAPTGTGKTYLALRAIESIGRKALIVVSKSDLVDQWVEEILNHTDIPVDRIGTGQMGSVDWEGKDIVISLVHTLALDRERPIFKQQFGVVVFDEVDKSVPPKTFASVAAMFPAKYRIGISATVARRDGLHSITDLHIGEHYLYMGKGQKMKAKVIVLPYNNAYAKEPPSHLTTMQKRGIILSQIEKDQQRNVYLCKFLKKLYQTEGRRTIVLSDRTKQLLDISKILETNGIPKNDVGFYTQSLRFPSVDKKGNKQDITKKVPQSERDRAATSCKIILATYGMLSTGTNIPDLSALLLATPQSTIKQAAGRIERFMEGKKQPLVFDVLDEAYEMANWWFKAREKEYKQQDMEVSIFTTKRS